MGLDVEQVGGRLGASDNSPSAGSAWGRQTFDHSVQRVRYAMLHARRDALRSARHSVGGCRDELVHGTHLGGAWRVERSHVGDKRPTIPTHTIATMCGQINEFQGCHRSRLSRYSEQVEFGLHNCGSGSLQLPNQVSAGHNHLSCTHVFLGHHPKPAIHHVASRLPHPTTSQLPSWHVFVL